MLEDMHFISRKQIGRYLLSGTRIYTNEHYWLITTHGVACCTYDEKIVNYKNTDEAIEILWKEDCKVDLE